MKITVATTVFKTALAKVLGVVSSKVTIPVLNNVKIDVLGATGKITASSLGDTVVATFALEEASGDGSFLVLAQRLNEIVGNVTAKSITFEQEGTKVSLKTGGFKAGLANESTAGFPVQAAVPEVKLTIPLDVLKRLVSRIENAVPSKDGKYAQAALQITRTGNKLRAASTDGYRIQVTEEEVEATGDFSLLLTKSILPVVKEMTGNILKVAESDNQFFFVSDQVLAIVNRPNQKFPNYAKATELQFKTSITLSGDDVASAISRTKALGENKNLFVTFSTDGVTGQMNLGSNSEIGHAEDSVESKVTGIANSARLSPKYVLEYLAKTEGPVTIEFVDERSIVKFGQVEVKPNGLNLAFIMAMRDPEAVKAEEAKAKEAAKAAKKAAA